MTRQTIEDRVAAGADLLDQLDPTWAYRVDLSKLDLGVAFWWPDIDDVGCIVMQVTQCDYGVGLIALGLNATEARQLGFAARSALHDDYEALYWAWAEEVMDRRPDTLVGGEAERLAA